MSKQLQHSAKLCISSTHNHRTTVTVPYASKGLGAPWTGCQSVTELTQREIHTYDRLESPINLTSISVGCGRKPSTERAVKRNALFRKCFQKGFIARSFLSVFQFIILSLSRGHCHNG